MNPQIKKLSLTTSAQDAIDQDLIRCGFELEFHALNGVSEEDSEDSEIDWDAVSEASGEAMSDTHCRNILGHIQGEELEELAKALSEFENDIYSIPDLIADKDLKRKLESAIKAACDSWRERWESDNCYHYRIRNDVYSSLDCQYSTSSIIDCGSDQSVRGGEIRTKGALIPSQFLAAADDLLSNNEFDVDTGCSFHIHLSVPGVRHQYSAKFQAELIAFILNNLDRIPSHVKDRMRSDSCARWCDTKIGEDKMTAVHYHSRYRTWEFRVFGNVDNADDAKACLELAIDAMRHAYLAKLKTEFSLLPASLIADEHRFRTAARLSRNQWRPLSEIVAEMNQENAA